MSFVAEASGVVRATPEKCFERFVDFSRWGTWMPRSFRPVRGPSRRLAVGDRLLVRIGVAKGIALPARLEVARVATNAAIGWRGGVPGLLVGEHNFLFAPEGEGATRLRSHETWSGALTLLTPFARRLKRDAERVGAEQIAAFTTWIERD